MEDDDDDYLRWNAERVFGMFQVPSRAQRQRRMTFLMTIPNSMYHPTKSHQSSPVG